MRNLAQYPITVDETHRVLADSKQAIIKIGAIGDTRDLVIQYVNEFLKDNKDFADFLEKKKIS
jgi:hypothetical protein